MLRKQSQRVKVHNFWVDALKPTSNNVVKLSKGFPKECPFAGNIDIYGFMDIQRFYQHDLKIPTFSLKHWYLWTIYGGFTAKTIFPKWSQKRDLPRNVDIYRDLEQKPFLLCKIISKISFSTICWYFWIYCTYARKHNF